MRIQTTAPDRKSLVKALAEHLGEAAIYCGPPSFAYSIGGARVDREGGIDLPEDIEPDSIRGLLISKGWLEENELDIPEDEPQPDDEPAQEPAPDPENEVIAESDRLIISIPADGLTIQTMNNLLRMLYSKQYLLGKALKEETIRISDEVIEHFQQTLHETPADFKTQAADFKAQGQIAGVEFAVDRISLSYPLSDRSDIIFVYTLLSVRLLEAAKAATRVQAQRQEPENEKYCMRGWLVRLGFGGKEYKGLRELFLKHLKGNSAFLTDEEADKHRAKYATIRRSQKDSESSEVPDEEG